MNGSHRRFRGSPRAGPLTVCGGRPIPSEWRAILQTLLIALHPTPSRGAQERLRAYHNADVRSAVLRDLGRGDLALRPLLFDARSELRRLPIRDLVAAQAGWTMAEARAVLRELRISERRTLRDLTGYQRLALAARVDPIWAIRRQAQLLAGAPPSADVEISSEQKAQPPHARCGGGP